MTAKSLGLMASDGSEYVTITDDSGNLQVLVITGAETITTPAGARITAGIRY